MVIYWEVYVILIHLVNTMVKKNVFIFNIESLTFSMKRKWYLHEAEIVVTLHLLFLNVSDDDGVRICDSNCGESRFF